MFKSKRFVIAGILALLTISLSIASVKAQTDNSSSGLSISPLHNQLELDPGQTNSLDLTIKNITPDPVVAKGFVLDFQSDNKTGNPVLITNSNKQSPYSIQPFISNLESIPLKPGEKKVVKVQVNVPKNTSPGSYFGILRYQAIPVGGGQPGGGKVSLTASVGTVVFVNVKGNVVQQLQLLSVKAYKGNNSGTLFFNKPDQAGVQLNNLGNTFVQPFGRVVVDDMYGSQVYSYEFNNSNPRSIILPKSKRIFKDKIKNINKVGRYTITASVSYGNGSDVLVGKETFWYIPAWLMAIIIVVIIVILALFYMVISRFRGYRRRGRKHNQ